MSIWVDEEGSMLVQAQAWHLALWTNKSKNFYKFMINKYLCVFNNGGKITSIVPMGLKGTVLCYPATQ